MRRMFSEKQVKNIVNQGIENGEIDTGKELFYIAGFFKGDLATYLPISGLYDLNSMELGDTITLKIYDHNFDFYELTIMLDEGGWSLDDWTAPDQSEDTVELYAFSLKTGEKIELIQI